MRKCSRLLGGKLIRLHNDSFLICKSLWQNIAYFQFNLCSLSQNVSESRWKCLHFIAYMVDLSTTFSCGNMKSNHVLFDRGKGLGWSWTLFLVSAGLSLQPLWKSSDFKVQYQQALTPHRLLTLIRVDVIHHFRHVKMLKLWTPNKRRHWKSEAHVRLFIG